MNFLEKAKNVIQKMSDKAVNEKKGFILGCGIGGIILGIFPPTLALTAGIFILIVSAIMIENNI